MSALVRWASAADDRLHRSAVGAALVLLLLGGAPRGLLAQGVQRDSVSALQSRSRFEGTGPVRVAGRADSVRVDVRQWSIAGGQRIAALALPVRGLLIVELRGGRLTTVIDGRRQERRIGEIWSVPPGHTMQVETGDDMATIQTTSVATP